MDSPGLGFIMRKVGDRLELCVFCLLFVFLASFSGRLIVG